MTQPPTRPRVYLDHANGRPLSAAVRTAVSDTLARCGNPSSIHAEGRTAAHLRDQARGQVASLIRAQPEELLFTSSATEANLWALAGLAKLHAGKGKHLVVSAVEHLSLLDAARRMEKEGWSVTVVPVDRRGQADPERVEEALTPQTALVSVQWANPEVGSLQPVVELACRVKAKGLFFHSDAVAAAGQVPVDVRSVPVDALSLAANAFGGPPGVGALFLRKGLRIPPVFLGGSQEDGRRAGTENLLGVVGMGAAAAEAAKALPALAEALPPLRERLVRGILNLLPEAALNGHPTERLPGHVSVSFPGVDAEVLLLTLDREGFSVGLGSACVSRTMRRSHVLKAMEIDAAYALGTLTCTLGPGNTQEEVEAFLKALPRAVAESARTREMAIG